MGNVRLLSIVKAHDYSHQCVEYLEELLTRAKDGEIAEVMITAKLAGGGYEHSYTGCADLHELVGQLERANTSQC